MVISRPVHRQQQDIANNGMAGGGDPLKPGHILAAKGQIIAVNIAITHHHQRRGILVRLVRQLQGLGGEGAGAVLLVHRELPGSLHHRKVHLIQREDLILPQLGHQVVDGEAQLLELLLVDFPVFYHHHRAAAEDPPHPPAVEIYGRDDNLEGDQAQDGEQAGKKGRFHLLNGQGGNIGDKDGHHQLGGLKLPQLPLAHQPHPEDDDHVKD